jgi:effector-binding domain-containing protein
MSVANPETILSETEIVQVEQRLAAIVRKRVPFAEMGKAQREARALLDATLAAGNVQPDEHGLTVWRSPKDGMIDYAPGKFVSRPIEVSGEVSLFTLPQGKAAHLRLSGSYEGLPEAWRRLFEECDSRGLERAGLNWEIYAPAETDIYTLLA